MQRLIFSGGFPLQLFFFFSWTNHLFQGASRGGATFRYTTRDDPCLQIILREQVCLTFFFKQGQGGSPLVSSYLCPLIRMKIVSISVNLESVAMQRSRAWAVRELRERTCAPSRLSDVPTYDDSTTR